MTPIIKIAPPTIQQTVEGSESNKYKLKFDHVETKNITGLTVRKELFSPFGLSGAVILKTKAGLLGTFVFVLGSPSLWYFS
jgi:hypothetical protein